jgi:DNA alkylation damage repair protein AlkB
VNCCLFDYVVDHLVSFRMDQLRWTTLGHHYDWTRRTYENCDVDELPKQLVELVHRVTQHTHTPDAAIVNYYPATRYQICSHRDDAERCPKHPVVSFSIGCDAVFLAGGNTHDDEVVA